MSSRRLAATAIALAVLAVGPCAAASLAEHDYVLHCAGCHGLDATGSRDVPSLQHLAGRASLPQWREYFARVPGVANAPVSDARLAALLDWVITQFSAGASAPAFSADEVGRLRRRSWTDPRAERARLLAESLGEQAGRRRRRPWYRPHPPTRLMR